MEATFEETVFEPVYLSVSVSIERDLQIHPTRFIFTFLSNALASITLCGCCPFSLFLDVPIVVFHLISV